MKLNEKSLSALATSPTPVDREGWLNKRGEVNKGYQKRWFVLKGNLLFYFDKKGDREPIGVIILEGCTIELAEDDDQFSFKIMFHGPNNRSYVLGAESQEAMELWMKALACAGYDYMKLMVAELQRQLDEMEENPDGLGNQPPQPPTRHVRCNPFNNNQSRSSQRERSDASQNIFKMTFHELHNEYGKIITADYETLKQNHLRKFRDSTVVEETLVSI